MKAIDIIILSIILAVVIFIIITRIKKLKSNPCGNCPYAKECQKYHQSKSCCK